MKRNRFVACISILSLFAGCTAFRYSPPDFSRISVGMTKQEVIQELGKPKQVAADGNTELLGYEWNYAYDTKIGGVWSYVVLIDGKVQRYFNERPESVSYSVGFNPAYLHSPQIINQINVEK